ncbi:MAG TPA: M14 family metallopeptidase [Gammaproteobacteria bacterium]
MLRVLDSLPDGLLALEASRLHEKLDGPTLIHLPGREPRPLYVSVLLHGNETTGWETVRALLAHGADAELPRALSLFIGNIAAAKAGLRQLDSQPDYNRIWSAGESPEHAMAAKVLGQMREKNPAACIDVHNTSGVNPHHAAINRMDNAHLSLASRFGHLVVFAERQQGLESQAFGAFCPSVVIECGLPDHPGGVEHARAYLESCLEPGGLALHVPHRGDIDLFHIVATVRVPDEVEFGFEGEAFELRLLPHLDELNFNELPAGTAFGEVRANGHVPLKVTDLKGNDARNRFFRVEDKRLITAVPVMPSLVSTDVRIIRQDCLCYLMERMPVPEDGA